MSLAEIWTGLIHFDFVAPVWNALTQGGPFGLILYITFGTLALMLFVDLLTSAMVAAHRLVTGKDGP